MTSLDQRWTSIHTHLKKLKCPFIDYLTNPSILFNQGEVRNATMTWIFTLYDTSWMRKVENKELTEIASLTLMASNMGLCAPNDVALVQGGGNQKKQTTFWETLIDLVLLRSEFGDNIDSQHSSHVEFMDNVSKDSKNIFKEKPFKFTFPLPLNPTFESVPDLELKVNELSNKVKILQDELAQLELYNEEDFTWSKEYTHKLETNLQATNTTLQQLNEDYTKELQPWVQAPPPDPFKALNIKQLVSSCHDVLQMIENYKAISNCNADLRQKQDQDIHDNVGDDIDEVSIASLNDKLAVINLYTSNKKKR